MPHSLSSAARTISGRLGPFDQARHVRSLNATCRKQRDRTSRACPGRATACRRRRTCRSRARRSGAAAGNPSAGLPSQSAQKFSGSCRFSQSIFGAVKLGIGMMPAICPTSGTASCNALHSAEARKSFQRMAGRTGSPLASSATQPCIWPERPSARTAPNSFGRDVRSASTACCSACHQAEGSCSDQPERGRVVAIATDVSAKTACASSTSTAFSDDVPRSIPRNVMSGQAKGGPPAAPYCAETYCLRRAKE